MKVICRICSGLSDEKDAISMSENEYVEFLNSLPSDTGALYLSQERKSFSYKSTQICQRCYSGKDEPEKKKQLSSSDRHTLFGYLKIIKPDIEPTDEKVQEVIDAYEGLIKTIVQRLISKRTIDIKSV